MGDERGQLFEEIVVEERDVRWFGLQAAEEDVDVEVGDLVDQRLILQWEKVGRGELLDEFLPEGFD